MTQPTTNEYKMEPLPKGRPPVFFCPLNNAVIRLGVATIEAEFKPKGESNDTHSVFVPFPTQFPDDEFANVRLIVTNRDQPQIVGAATTGLKDGVQGFELMARNTLKAADATNGPAEVNGVSFSWMAVLLTNEPQDEQYDVRFGLVPFREYREFSNPMSFTFPDTDKLFADAPLNDSGEKFIFLTTTVSGAANTAAINATSNGIPEIHAHQTGAAEGGCRLHWLVISPRSTQSDSDESYFNGNNLWLHAARGEPSQLDGRAWKRHWRKFVAPFCERSPCTFATANRHGVTGHLSGAVAMSWKCQRDSYSVMYRSFDPEPGEANSDAITIGHCDATLDEVAAGNLAGPPSITPWERFLDDGWHGPEHVRDGEIGANEFHESGVSLLLHTIYEDHVDEFQKLLELGANVNQQQPITQARPIHIAAAYKREKIIKLLIEKNADVNAKTVNGTESDYPLRWKLLNQYRPYRGETALHLAIYYRNFRIARVLLEAGADPNAEDDYGDRPIDYLPRWHTYPDNETHWRLINERGPATKTDYERIFDWILEEKERYKRSAEK